MKFVDRNVNNGVNDDVMNTEAFPPFIHLAQEPLGLFLRPGHSDHALASQLFSEGHKGEV